MHNRLYLDRRQSFEKKFYPRSSDRNFTLYADRIRKEGQVEHFCLALNGVQNYFLNFHDQAKNFFSKMFSKNQLLKFSFESSIFLGDYLETPFGHHADGCTTILFPIHGEKEMHFWAAEKDICNSPELILRASPGQTLMWPPDYFHVAKGSGQFTCAITIGRYEIPQQQMNTRILGVAEILTGKKNITKISRSVMEVSEAIVDLIQLSQCGFLIENPNPIIYSKDLEQVDATLDLKMEFKKSNRFILQTKDIHGFSLIVGNGNALLTAQDSLELEAAQAILLQKKEFTLEKIFINLGFTSKNSKNKNKTAYFLKWLVDKKVLVPVKN